MKFTSTRGGGTPVGLSEAIVKGLAADGGLFVPDRLPVLSPTDLPDAEDLPAVAAAIIAPFAKDDAIASELTDVCREAFNFPAPLLPLEHAEGDAVVLELFHGPTCAFKDFGARFMAAALERIHRSSPRPVTIVVATSGDTGGAVAAAFHRRPSIEVVLLYPKGLVSPRQAQQLACWGDNVRTFAVAGTFDDCQRIAKEAFRDPALTRARELSSANSINVGRLLPQMVYYAAASLRMWRRDGRKANFAVPSGNLGNVTAGVWARAVGLPIGDIVMATNENRVITEFIETGEWHPHPSVPTLASAMDVGNPSNMERLRSLFPSRLGSHLSAVRVSDDEIRTTIRQDAAALGYVWDPHGATAAHVYHHLSGDQRDRPWVLVETAHPAKFHDIVEPLVGRAIPVPPALARLLSLPRQEEDLGPDLASLRTALGS